MRIGSRGNGLPPRLLERFVVWSTVAFVLAKAAVGQASGGFLVDAIGSGADQQQEATYLLRMSPGAKRVDEMRVRPDAAAGTVRTIELGRGLFGGGHTARAWAAIARVYGYSKFPLLVQLDRYGHVRVVRAIDWQ